MAGYGTDLSCSSLILEELWAIDYGLKACTQPLVYKSSYRVRISGGC